MPDLTPEDISKLNLVPSSISLWICDQARKAADEYLSYRWKLIAGGAALVLMFFTYAGYSLDKAARDLQERAGKVQQLADDSVKEANKRKQDIDSILKSVELYKTQIEYLQKRVNDQTDDSGRQLREVRDEHSKVNAVVSSVQASAFQVKNAEASIGASKTDIDKKHGIVLTKSSQVDVAANTVEVKSKETKDLFDKLQQKTETLSKLETELAHSYDELFGLKQQELIFMLSTDQRDISLSFFPKVKIENGKVQVPPAKKVKVTIRTHGINPLTVEIDVIERPDGSRGVKEFFSKLAYNRETPSDHIIQGTPFKFRVDFIYHDRLAHDWVVLRFLVDTEKIPFYSALQNPTPKTENESMVAAEWRPESMGAGQKFERYFGTFWSSVCPQNSRQDI
ncbi:MAG: hypothetical protein HY046_12160 [Acidobacteria bacterium]|nr:hypothetical protein [Acidobacteriota bacterium]